jgi:hypothetical protein
MAADTAQVATCDTSNDAMFLPTRVSERGRGVAQKSAASGDVVTASSRGKAP